MHIVVIHVVLLENLKTKEKHREDTAKLKKAKRTTVKQKIGADTV